MFTHLHIHSHYSLLDGLAKIDDLLDKAVACKMDALALTDHGVMYGAIEFYEKARERGIKPLLGVEAYLANNRMSDKRPNIDNKQYHLILLAKNKVGYQNLIKLTTQAHLEGFYYKPRIDKALLKQHSEGLIAASACLKGEVAQALLAGNRERAEKLALEYRAIFGEDFYLELQNHPNIPEQKKVNAALVQIAKKHNLPLIATTDTHYLNKEDAEAQEILLCLQGKNTLEDERRLSMIDEDFSFKTPQEMAEAFRDFPEALENTAKVAAKIDLQLTLGETHLPHFAVPDGKTHMDYLKMLCDQGFARRFGKIARQIPQEYRERLEYELAVIEKTGFATYFLIVQDFVNWAKKNKIVVGPGRGSAAGSLVSFLLNITDIDPIQYDLLFERFLNPERISMPDIDLDFADTRRDEVLDYVRAKYGRDHVAQIITFGTMAARAAVRDVGRVLGYAYSFCDQIAKMIPMSFTLDKALAKVPELKQAYQNDPKVKRLLDTAKKLEGVARHASTHACGVVITQEPLDTVAPRQYASASDKTIVSQYEMNAVAAIGLLKMDFLGLKNLTILENTLRIIKKIHGLEMDFKNIPLDDQKTFALLSQARTTGVFQLESSGMKRYLRDLKPTELEDIIAMVALYRPGPMEWIPNYINGKHQKIQTTYLHPKLKPILEKTYGVAVYQEQVLEMARNLAGFSLGQADILRKAVGKKIPKLLQEQKEKFVEGCVKNGIKRNLAKKIFSFIEPFAGYGFNRAHAACYAYIGYLTAYLKAHYPAEFMAALLTSDQHDTDRVAIEVQECANLGIKILPPDINESFANFTVLKQKKGAKKENQVIRFGLSAIKNVGTHVVQEIIEERKKNGPYQNLDDFMKRVQSKDLNKKSLESLVKCGALDQFGERNQILNNVDKILRYAREHHRAHQAGQRDLFGRMAQNGGQISNLRLEDTPAATNRDKVKWEKELLGLYISHHPLEEYRELLALKTTPVASLKTTVPHTGAVTIGGIITKIKKIITRKGDPMLFVLLEDLTESIELLVFPGLLSQTTTLWQEEKVILVMGKLSDKDGEIKMLADHAQEITNEGLTQFRHSVAGSRLQKEAVFVGENRSVTCPTVHIKLPNNADRALLMQLKEILTSHPGQCPVYLKIPNGSPSTPDRVKTQYNVDPASPLTAALTQILGPENIIIKAD